MRLTVIGASLAIAIIVASNAWAAARIGVVTNDAASNPFGGYMTEILKTEGFGSSQMESLPSLTLDKLQAYDTVILAETSLTGAQSQIFRNYVAGGGNLIGMRPDGQLDDVFGIARASGTVSEGYMKISAATPIGAGLETAASMKTHGVSDRYGLAAGAVKVASLYSSGSSDTNYASVVQSSYGSGKAMAFSYDLSKSIAYMRQGNPALANEEHDGVDGIRPADMFYDSAASSSWNDVSRSTILQADEQMRLLSHSITAMNTSAPIPRLWYFPNAKKSVLVMTGDQDGGSVADMNAQFNAIKARGGTGTVYLLDSERPSAGQVDSWIADGHEVAIHFDATAQDTHPTWAGMNNVYNAAVANFQSRYPGASLPASVRNHHLVWCGENAVGEQEFAAQAMIEANHGLKLDFHQYYWRPDFQGDGGYSIPSGLPMRFTTSAGELLDVFQADTQITDEGLTYQAAEQYAALLDASIHQGKYAWIAANFHPCSWGLYGAEAEAILDTAFDNDIPIWSGAKMDSFLRMRDAAEFQNVVWDGRELLFDLVADVSGEGDLTLMLPSTFNLHGLHRLSLNGAAADFSIETIAGFDYALFTVGSGTTSVRATFAPEPNGWMLLLSSGVAIGLWRRLGRRNRRCSQPFA